MMPGSNSQILAHKKLNVETIDSSIYYEHGRLSYHLIYNRLASLHNSIFYPYRSTACELAITFSVPSWRGTVYIHYTILSPLNSPAETRLVNGLCLWPPSCLWCTSTVRIWNNGFMFMCIATIFLLVKYGMAIDSIFTGGSTPTLSSIL